MKIKCKRLAVFPTNHTHKALVSLNNQTFYGTGPLTIKYRNMEYKNVLVFGFNGEKLYVWR
ncbi:MAG: hypothetical protein QT05_C0049G0013 [archaeon GW2011_AR13]|nr:MAG: hypothetical protein QT05_C0049G0013 [archaeon GW2011_AR13]